MGVKKEDFDKWLRASYEPKTIAKDFPRNILNLYDDEYLPLSMTLFLSV